MALQANDTAARAASEHQAEALTDRILAHIRPVVMDQVRMAASEIAAIRASEVLEAVRRKFVEEQPTAARVAQDVRKEVTGLPGRAAGGVVNFLRTRDDGATGTEILDRLETERPDVQRASLQKAITRAKDAGSVRKSDDGKWRLTEKGRTADHE